MATQYTTILKLALPTQGELSGTWGDVVNDNITAMVEEAIAGRKVINTWTTNSHTLTSADGTTSESRAAILTLTDTSTALSGAGTVICPAASKIYIVENGTGQTITVKTSSGTGIAVPNGKNMVVFCDGTNVEEGITNINSLTLNGDGATVSSIKDEDNMASDSATALATQQSIKAYVDSQVGTVDTLAEVLANGNTTGGTDIAVGTGDDITFADSSKAIFGAGSDLQIYSDGTNSYIQEGSGTSGIRITTDNQFLIRKHDDETIAAFNVDGAVRLYFDNTQRFATTSTGIDVTGNIAVSSAGARRIDISNTSLADTGEMATLQWDANADLTFQGRASDGTFKANWYRIEASDSDGLADAHRFYTDSSAERMAITSTGIDVTGTIVGDGLDVTVGTNDRTLLREFNSVNNLSSVNAANSTFRPFEISALGTTISYGGTDTLIAGNNTVNFYLNSGSVSHNFAYNENGGEISLSDETGAVATLLDQSNNNTRLLELVDGSNIQVGLGGANTTGALIFTKASGAEFGRITGSGYFGLNNTNPDTTLHIGNISATNATAQGRIKLEDTSGSLANDGGLEFVTSAFGSGYGWKINSVDSTGVHLDFGTRQNSTTWSDKIRFMWDGRVVIGDTTTNSAANRLKVQGSQGDDRIAISTANTSGNATVEAQVANYWSGTTYTGTGIVQYDSAASGTTSGISNANLGMLRFQNGSAGLILANGSTPIHFATQGTRRMTLNASGNFIIGDSTAKTRLQVSGAGAANAPSLGSVSSNVPLYLTNADTAYGLVVGTNNATGHAWLQAQRTDGTATSYPITLNEAGGNVGIGGSSFDSKLHVQGGSLGTTANDSLRIFESSYTSSNVDKLEFVARRLSNGSDWQTAAQSIQRKVDSTLMGYVRFGNNGSEPVSFGNGTTEYARFDENGFFAIGLSDPASALHVQKNTNNYVCRFENTDASTPYTVWIREPASATSGYPLLNISDNGGTDTYFRADSGGNVYVGTSSSVNTAKSSVKATSSTNCLGLQNVNNNNYLITALNASSTEVFRVAGDGDVTNTNNSYGSLSDERLKSNIVDASSQLDDIMAVQVRSYTLDSTGETHIGVVAQELESSGMSGLVSEDKDGMKSVKYSVLYMKALKALQEAMTKIEDLEARVATLEGAN
jgi:hypothetical protein